MTSATERLEAILRAHPCLVGEGEKMASDVLERLRVIHESHPSSVDGVPVSHEGCIWCESMAEINRLREQVARLAVALENAQKSATYFMTAHDKLREAAQRVVRSHEQIKKSIKDERGEEKAAWMSERIAAIDALAALLKGQ